MYNPYKFDLKYMETLIASEPCKMKFSLEKQKESFNYEFLERLYEEVLKEENLKFEEDNELYEEVERIYEDPDEFENFDDGIYYIKYDSNNDIIAGKIPKDFDMTLAFSIVYSMGTKR